MKKCHILNTFGSLAIAGMLVMGGAGLVGSAHASADVDIKGGVTEAHVGDFVVDTAGKETFFTPIKVHEGSTFTITGDLISSGTTHYPFIYIGENSTNTAQTTGMGTLIVDGSITIDRAGIFVSNGSLTTTALTITYQSIPGAITVGSTAFDGTLTVTGAEGMNLGSGTNSVHRGTITAQKAVVSGKATLRSGSSGTSAITISGADGISLSNSAALEADFGDIVTTKLTVDGSSPDGSNMARVKIGEDGEGGKLTATGDVAFNNGAQLLIGKGTFDLSNATSVSFADTAGTLTMGHSSILKIKEADITSLGKTVDGEAGALLVITDTTHDARTVNEYEDIVTTLRDAFYTAGNLGTVAVHGIEVAGYVGLDDIGAGIGYYAPTTTIAGGNMNLASNVTVSGVTGSAASVAGEGTILTLTGNDGTNAVETAVDLTATDNGTLNLGSIEAENKDFLIRSNIVATLGGDIAVNRAEVTVMGAGGVNLSSTDATKTSDLTIGAGAKLDASIVTLGDNATILTNGTSELMTGNLTANGGAITIDDDSVIRASVASLLGSATMDVQNKAEFFVTDTTASNITTLTMADTSVLTVKGGGIATVESLNFSGDAQIKLSGSSTSRPDFTIQDDYEVAPDVFSASSGAGKIQVGQYSDFRVLDELSFTTTDANKTLALHGSGTIHTKTLKAGDAGLVLTSGIVIVDNSVTISDSTKNIDVQSGTLRLIDGGTIISELKVSEMIVGGVTSGGTLEVTEGNWNAMRNITVSGEGKLTIDGGTLTTFGFGSTANIIDVSNGELIVTDHADSNLAISKGGTLKVSVDNLGAIDLTAASGSQFTEFNVLVEKDFTTDGTGIVVLTGYTGGAVALETDAYDALIAEVTADLFGAGSTLSSLTIDGITEDIVVRSLTDVFEAMDKPASTIGAGNYDILEASTFAGITAYNGNSNSTINGPLTLTGAGNTNGVYSVGDLTVESGAALTLGHKDYALSNGGTVQGKLVVEANTADADAYIDYNKTNIVGGIEINSKGSSVTVRHGAEVTTSKIILSNAGTSARFAQPDLKIGMLAANDFKANENTGYGTGKVTVTGADGIVSQGGFIQLGENAELTTTKLTMTGDLGTVQVGATYETLGEALSTADTTKISGATFKADEVSMTGDAAGDNVSFQVNNGTAEIGKATFTNVNQVYVGRGDYQREDGTTRDLQGNLTITGAEGLTIDGGNVAGEMTRLLVENGTLKTTKLTLENNVNVTVGAFDKNGVIHITGDDARSATDFAAVSYDTSNAADITPEYTVGKIALSTTGLYQVDGTLTMAGGTLTTAGAIVAKDLVVTGALTVNGAALRVNNSITSSQAIHLGAEAAYDVYTSEATPLVSAVQAGRLILSQNTTFGAVSSLNANVNAKATGTGIEVLNGSNWALSSGKTIDVSDSGRLLVTDGTLDTSAGTLKVASSAGAFSVADGATLVVAEDAFGTISKDGSFTKGTDITKQLSNDGELVISGLAFDTMSKAADAQLQASQEWKDLVAGTGEVTLLDVNGNEVEMTGFYSLTWLVNNAHDEVVMAGDMKAGYNSTFTGIVKNTDLTPNLTNSTLAAGATLTLTGAKKDGTLQALLDEGTLENSGILNLGVAGASYTADFNGQLTTTNGGVTNVLSSVTTSEMVTIDAGGMLDIKGGTLDVTAGLTADAADLSSVKNTTIIVDGETIGSNAEGVVTLADATVTGASADSILGNVTITGFNGTEEDPLRLAYGNTTGGVFTNGAYNDLVDAATAAFGTGGSITLENVKADTSNTTLHTVAGQNDITLGSNTVIVDASDPTSNQVEVGHSTEVGSIAGSVNGVAMENAGSASVTGLATDDTSRTGLLADADIKTIGIGETKLGNTVSRSKLQGSADSTTTTGGTTSITKVDVAKDILGGGGMLEVIDSTAQNLIAGSGETTIEGLVKITETTTATASKLTVTNGSLLQTKNLSGTNVAIEIGDTTGAAGLISEKTTTVGGYMKYDPPIVAGEGIDKAAFGVHGSFADSGIATTHNVIQNSIAVFGDTDTAWAVETFNNSGLTWGNATGEVNAALFIRAPQTLDTTTTGSTGAVEVDGSKTVGGALTAGTAIFADNSLLVIDANGVVTDAALSVTGGNLTVADTAKLHIVDGKDKQVVTVVSGFDTNNLAANAWGGDTSTTDPAAVSDNLTLSSSSLAVDGIVWDKATGNYEVTLKVVFDPVMYQPYMQTPTGEYLNDMTRDTVGIDTNSAFAGRKLISRALTEDVYNMGLSNVKGSVATIEGAAQLGAVANVGKAGMSVMQSMGNAIIDRSSKAGLNAKDSGKGGGSMTLNNGQVTAEVGTNSGNMASKSGFGVWLTPLYKWNTGNGFDAGNLGHSYDMGLGGIALGADYTNAFAHDGAIRFGLALNVGAGYSDSTGDFNETNNDFNFWGLSAYAALQKENFVATLDLGFSSIYNEVTQDLSSSMAMGKLDANIDSFVFTAGLNLEYTFVTDFMNITPHAGIRYMSVTSYGYDIGSSAGRVASVDETTQDVWYFPVGVTFSKDIVNSNGWIFTPKLDVGFIAAAGDFDTVSRTAFTGVPGTLELEMQNVDGFAFNGGLGFELANKETGVSLGLNYNLQAGEKETSHMIFANFRYEF